MDTCSDEQRDTGIAVNFSIRAVRSGIMGVYLPYQNLKHQGLRVPKKIPFSGESNSKR